MPVPAAPLCKLAGAYLPLTIVHITYSLDALLLLPFGRPAAPLGQESIWSSGRHIRTHRLPGWATPRCTCPPATCPPTTATSPNNSDAQIAYCLEATWQTTIFTHQGHIHKGIRRPGSDNKIYVCILLKVLMWCTTTGPQANATF